MWKIIPVFLLLALCCAGCFTRPVENYRNLADFKENFPKLDIAELSKKKVLTLRDAQKTAIANNPDYIAAYHAVYAAKFRYYRSLSAYLPTVDLNMSVGQSLENSRDLRNPPEGVVPRENHFSTDIGLRASYLIFDGLAREFAADHGVGPGDGGEGLFKVDVEGVRRDDLADGEADQPPLREEGAALQPQRVVAHEGADDGPVLLLQPVRRGVELRLPLAEHLHAGGDEAARQAAELPGVRLFKAVAEIALAVQLLAAHGGELFRQVEVVEVVAVGREYKAARAALLHLRAVLLRDAAYGQRVAALPGKLRERVERRLQRSGADGEGEKGLAVPAQLGEHAPAEAGDELVVGPVPHVDVAEVEVGGAGILRRHDGVNPGLVRDGHTVEVDHMIIQPFSKCAYSAGGSPPAGS